MAKVPSAPKQPVGGKTSGAPSKPSNKIQKGKGASMMPATAASAPSAPKVKIAKTGVNNIYGRTV